MTAVRRVHESGISPWRFGQSKYSDKPDTVGYQNRKKKERKKRIMFLFCNWMSLSIRGTWMLFTYTRCTDIKISVNTDYFVVLIFQAITGWGIRMFFTYTRCTDIKTSVNTHRLLCCSHISSHYRVGYILFAVEYLWSSGVSLLALLARHYCS